MKTISRHRQTGLNLIEVLIAAVVLSIGLLGLAGLQVSSLKSSQDASFKQQATLVIEEVLERMRSNRTAALAATYPLTVNCTGTAPASCNGTPCLGGALLQSDLNETLCRSGMSGTTAGIGLTAQLLDSVLVISCPGSSCADGVSLSLTWTERLEQAQAATTSTAPSVGTNPAPPTNQTFTLQVNAVL